MTQQYPLITETETLYQRGTLEPEKPRFRVQTENGWQTISWGDYLNYTTQIALYFTEIGVGWNTKVAIFAKNQLEFAYFDMAIHAVRSVLVPVYASNTPKQVKYILNHSDSEIVITELERLPLLLEIWQQLPLIKKIIILDSNDEFVGSLNQLAQQTGITEAELNDKMVSLTDIYQRGELLNKEKPQGLQPFINSIQPDDLSTILYTSGTTGEPKGVMLTRLNLGNNSQDWIQVLGNLMPDTRIDLLWLPMSHIFGWGELGLGNSLGFTTYLTTHTAVLNDMPAIKPTIFFSVPAYWEKLYLEAKASSTQKADQIKQLHQLTGGRLKFCLSGGAGLQRQVKEFFYEAGLLIIEGYGLTECSPTLTMNRKDDFDFDTVGKPFPSVQLKLAPDGEILVKGLNLFNAYYKNPQATADSFDDDGWFKTGDLGELTSEGFLTIKGRKKEIIVTSGGKNISPQLIESQFKDDPYIEHIVVYGNERKYLTALITLSEPNVINYATKLTIPYDDYAALVQTPEIRALIQKRVDDVNNQLASYETIKKFLIHDGHLTVEAGYLTPSLKLKRTPIYQTFEKQLDELYYYDR